MRLVKYLLVIIILGQVLLSCNSKKQETSQRDSKMIKKHIKIDDKIIETRDPMKVIDPLWWSVSIYDSKEKYEKDLEPFSFHQRAVFALMWYMAEVNNGGHSQFYSNSTGIVWEDAMDGFELIGLTDGMKIIEESAKRFGTKPSFDREKRENALDLLDEDFDDLDSRFYKLDSAVNITERIADHIEKYKEAFYFEGEIEVPKN
jgi:hypothetical protein